MKVLSIEFNSEHIHLYVLDVQKTQAKIERAISLDMPANAYSSGMLINNDRSVSDLISAAVKEAKIKEKKTILAISGLDCMTEEFSVPDGKPKEIDGMVEQELAKRRKLNANYIYDYIILGKDPLKAEFISVRVVLCPKALINNYYDVVSKSGLIPYRIDLISHSMELLAKKSGLANSADISIMACINKDEVHFIYCGRNEEPYYRRASIKTEEGFEESMFVLSANSKFNLGFDDEENQIETIIENITKLSRFHSQRHPDLNISNIYVYGDYDNLPVLCDRIENAVGIPSKIFNVVNAIPDLGSKMNEPLTGSVNVIGNALALLDPLDVNFEFFEKIEEAKQEKGNSLFWLPAVVSVCLAALVVMGFSFVKIQNTRMEKRIEAAEEFSLNPDVMEAYYKTNFYLDNIDDANDYNVRGENYIDALKKGYKFKTDILKTIDKNTIPGVTVYSVSCTDDTISLGCYGDTQYSPSEFAKVLSGLSEFSDVTYTGFNTTGNYEGNKVYAFNITMNINKEGGAK